eukprot:TRINITY_DN71959_c0_g1_i1.p1 TRINITY_DN71959_c0_g1~~TRINITY_DN71959_c0_g1_i1.p1  ORF type:complete len:195 (-),score=50.30 TRINITY_DN71959_c0_g1_i1:97-660(-)
MMAMSLAILDHIGPVLQSMRQEELLQSFGPQGLVALRLQLPEAPTLAKTVGAWLPKVHADLERPLNARVDIVESNMRLMRVDSSVVSPLHRIQGLESFFETIADVAGEAKAKELQKAVKAVEEKAVHAAEQLGGAVEEKAAKAAQAVEEKATQAKQFAVKAVTAGAETGRALFNSLISKKWEELNQS